MLSKGYKSRNFFGACLGSWGALNARYMKNGDWLFAASSIKSLASSAKTSLQCFPPCQKPPWIESSGFQVLSNSSTGLPYPIGMYSERFSTFPDSFCHFHNPSANNPLLSSGIPGLLFLMLSNIFSMGNWTCHFPVMYVLYPFCLNNLGQVFLINSDLSFDSSTSLLAFQTDLPEIIIDLDATHIAPCHAPMLYACEKTAPLFARSSKCGVLTSLFPINPTVSNLWSSVYINTKFGFFLVESHPKTNSITKA